MGDSVRLSCGVTVDVPHKRPAPVEGRPTLPHRLMEKVNNVWGSTAGAGSDFFHTYRKHRATEMDRLKQLDEEYEDEKEATEFEERYCGAWQFSTYFFCRREELARLNEARAVKSAAKRQRVKERRQKSKELKKRGVELNNFRSDGSFLTHVLNHQMSSRPLKSLEPSSTRISPNTLDEVEKTELPPEDSLLEDEQAVEGSCNDLKLKTEVVNKLSVIEEDVF